MDFEITFTPDIEAFRSEVSRWLDEDPPEFSPSVAYSEDEDDDGVEWNKRLSFRRKLGGQGWLYPTAPNEYGGGGLTSDHAIIISQELERRGIPSMQDLGHMASACILVWGTEEQRRRFAEPILTGEATTWQLLTEPQGGTDLASAQTRAVRDGDDYIVNGNKVFVAGRQGVDFLWTLVNTDPNGQRHRNLTYLMIPGDLPGITVTPMSLLSGFRGGVFFDNVRVPGSCRIGPENEAWTTVASSNMELEHGGGGNIATDRQLQALIAFLKETKAKGEPLLRDEGLRDLFAQAYIERETERLFGLRNFWMRNSRVPMAHEGPQLNHWRKGHPHSFARATQDILGYYALTQDPAYAPAAGLLEQQQRGAFAMQHAGGGFNIQATVLARRLGIGRTVQEEAGRVNL